MDRIRHLATHAVAPAVTPGDTRFVETALNWAKSIPSQAPDPATLAAARSLATRPPASNRATADLAAARALRIGGAR